MKKIGYLMGMLLLLVSCERIAMKPDVENTPEAVFESLWTTVDEKYSFFAYKNIDWDSIYRRYRPEIHGGISEELLFRYCAGALFALRDGHVNIESSWNVSRNWDWKLDYPENLNSTLVTRNYLGKDYWITGALENQILREEVGYVRYRSFTSPVSEEDIDKVLERFSLLKGMIIDVRGNGGGDMGNITTLVSRFTSSPFVYGTFVQKSGPGHEDFTEPIALKQSATKSPPYRKKVVVLTNRGCYSATNDFVLRMKELYQVTIMGDTTGGGGGLPIYCELPNGWIYRFSTTQTFDNRGINTEGGIAPDHYVALDPADEAAGIDTMIEQAIAFIQGE